MGLQDGRGGGGGLTTGYHLHTHRLKNAGHIQKITKTLMLLVILEVHTVYYTYFCNDNYD